MGGLDGRNRVIVIAESLPRVSSPRFESLAFVGGHISPQIKKIVLIDLAFVALRFELRDWHSFVRQSFHVELRYGLRELTAFNEH